MIELQTIRDLDHQIRQILTLGDINPEEITKLVDNREQILQNVLDYIKVNPEFAKSEDWLSLMEETKQLVGQLQSETNQIGTELIKFRRGNKSVQQYKKFL
ncbi:flagellar protein FliT [Vibrio sp. SCSIO 43135]|uniref:Flagellar protein FliT n=1 Tax=Vibrio paucivorans TaxID=2829489 RepID=A0A9X3CD14_9VIBR|nr:MULTISPECIES: flagellar protein FliT [Vibrio]MCW8333501.1 flagellar protein FliT [Vibrio paucivorans]USD40389.1 flagellar protein FliT [Vibrio sp. SCSIO 43135]